MATDKYWQKDGITGAPVVALPLLTSTVDRVPPYGGALLSRRTPSDACASWPLQTFPKAVWAAKPCSTKSLSPSGRQPNCSPSTLKQKTTPTRPGGRSSAYGHVDSLGKIFELAVVGEFADGITRPPSSPTRAPPIPQATKAHPQGLTGRTVTDRWDRQDFPESRQSGKQATLDVRVEVNPEPNEPPIADAGTAKTVKAGTKVRLNGLLSRDPEESAVLCVESGNEAARLVMLDVNMAEPSFVAPMSPRLAPFGSNCASRTRKATVSPAYVDVTVDP